MLGAPREEAASKMLGCLEAGVVTGEMASRSAWSVWGDLGDSSAMGLLAAAAAEGEGGPGPTTTGSNGGGAAASSFGDDEPALAVAVGVVSGGGCVVIRMTMASMDGRRKNSSPARAASLS